MNFFLHWNTEFKYFLNGKNLVVRQNSAFNKIGDVYKDGSRCYTEI